MCGFESRPVLFNSSDQEGIVAVHYLKLLKLAEGVIAEHPEATTDSVDDRLLLSMPEPEKHSGGRVRLFRSRGPMATILNGRDGRLTVYVSARRVKDYLSGLVVKSELP